nr:prephenate dehydrogenase [Maliibacterium massiliense]
MNIAVIGLGLIGGSFCKTIKARTAHTCRGYDIDQASMEEALVAGAIDAPLALEELPETDLVIVALHPKQTIAFFQQHAHLLPKDGVVIDACGIKGAVVEAVYPLCKQQGVTFIGTHPMAGREFSGFHYATDNLFDKASFIITPMPDTPKVALLLIEDFANTLGFSQVVISDCATHDAVIAFTSQLAHVVSNAYVKSPMLQDESGYSAGSFLDLTRVAKLNEYMWTDLFLFNRDALLRELNILIAHLAQYRQALADGDETCLRQLLADGRVRKEESLRRHVRK